MKLTKIKSIKHIGKQRALNISMKKNKNFMLENGILTHNTRIAQDALRSTIEIYASNSFFILTCNNINKIIEPLRSRCITIPFAYPKKEDIYTYLLNICNSEKIKYSKEGMFELIELNYPSIRNCVLALQDLKTDNKDVVLENVKPVDEVMERMWNLLNKKDWKPIKTELMQTTVDPRELNTYFWKKALDENRIRMIQITCKNERDIALGADPKVIMVTSLIEMCR